MTNEKDSINKRFIYTAIIGSTLVMAVLAFSMLWASRKTVSTTDEAVSAVSSFYLEAMADQRARTINNLINNNFEHMDKALTVIRDEDIESQEELRNVIGKIKTVLSLNRFALVDEDNTVYTQYTTYSGGSRYDFLSSDKLSERVISTAYMYGSSKQLCLATPADGLEILGKPFKACFVQIDIKDISDLLLLEDQGNTYFALYTKNGGNLSDSGLGLVGAGENILEDSKDYISRDSWEKLSTDFEEGKEGSLTLVSDGIQETICYAPVPDTGWMMAVLIRESVIHEQFLEISDNNRRVSRMLIIVTLLSMVIFAAVLLLQSRRISRMRLETERENSRMFRSMANTDSMTGVRNKHAYSEYEKHLNNMIRSGELRNRLAVLVCDVNGLKHVNDTKGHAAGDQLIKDACSLICEHFVHGTVFRIGGDEFAVILQEKGYDTLDETLSSINREIEDNISRDRVVISIGHSVLNEEDRQIHDVFERADNLMYQRKKELKAMGAKTRE
ncbi:MAG: diguanylate cyclase [Lachnospiraceae bacterium]|nr:diguanylate cyclase [Lachnospiraceae bacterium]